MPETVTFTVRIPKLMKDGLARLAEATDRTQSYLLTEALQDYLDAQSWQVQAIKEAIQKANSGKACFMTHEDVLAAMRERSARHFKAAKE